MRKKDDDFIILSKIKACIQSRDSSLIIMFHGKYKPDSNTYTKFYLRQFEEEFFEAGQPIPKGSYVLCNETALDNLSDFNIINDEKRSMNTVRAFFLPYVEGKEVCKRIDDPTVNLMVTPRMTGCTFVGELNTANPRVIHSNLVTGADSNEINQTKINKNIVEKFHKSSIYTLKKSDYVSSKLSSAATVIGFRTEQGSWQYQSQITLAKFASNGSKKINYTVQAGKTSFRAKTFFFFRRTKKNIQKYSSGSRPQWSDPEKQHVL